MEQWRTSELTDAAESYARALEQARRAIGAERRTSQALNRRTWTWVGGLAAAAGLVMIGFFRFRRDRPVEFLGGGE